MEGESGKHVELSVKNRKRILITNSGRMRKLPKHLETTSEDDGPSRKRTKTLTSIEAEKTRLRAALQLYNNSKTLSLTGNPVKQKEKMKKLAVTESPSHINPYIGTSHYSPTTEVEDNLQFLSPTAKPDDGITNDHFANTFKLLLEIKKDGETTRKQNQEILRQMEEMKQQNKEILRQNVEIIEHNKEVKTNAEAMTIMLNKESNKNVKDEALSNKLFQLLEGFPLRTLEEFDRVESKTSNKLRNDLYHHLKCRDAAEMRKFFSLALKAAMTDQVNFSVHVAR